MSAIRTPDRKYPIYAIALLGACYRGGDEDDGRAGPLAAMSDVLSTVGAILAVLVCGGVPR